MVLPQCREGESYEEKSRGSLSVSSGALTLLGITRHGLRRDTLFGKEGFGWGAFRELSYLWVLLVWLVFTQTLPLLWTNLRLLALVCYVSLEIFPFVYRFVHSSPLFLG